MPIFPVQRFKVTECSQRIDGVTRETRAIEIEGRTGEGGRQDRASLVFSPVFDAAWPGPAVGYARFTVSGGTAIVGWFPVEKFAAFEAILKDERPAQVQYELRDQGTTGGYLRALSLASESGPRESSGKAQAGAGIGRPARQLSTAAH
jgi:hypothetical protein